MTKTPPKTFDIQSFRDWMAKMERERQRYEQALSRVDKSDHATNFVVTAWHMADWIWASTGAPKDQVAHSLGKSVDQLKLSDFHSWIKKECPPLEYCQIIGNFSKHAESRWDRPNVDTTVSVGTSYSFSPITASSTATAEWVDNKLTFKVIDDGRRLSASDLFQDIEGFWSKMVGP